MYKDKSVSYKVEIPRHSQNFGNVTTPHGLAEGLRISSADCYTKNPKQRLRVKSMLQSFLSFLNKMRKTYAEVRKMLNHRESLGGQDHLMQSRIICGDDRNKQRKPTLSIL